MIFMHDIFICDLYFVLLPLMYVWSRQQPAWYGKCKSYGDLALPPPFNVTNDVFFRGNSYHEYFELAEFFFSEILARST